MEQLVARWAHNPKAVSSSLAPATFQRPSQNKIWDGLCFFTTASYFEKSLAVNELNIFQIGHIIFKQTARIDYR